MTKPVLIFLFLLAAVPRASFGQSTTFASCPCTLKGRVLNSVTGAPIRNALVESGAGPPNSTLTDSDGDFHFDGLAAGSATLSAIKPGFLPSTPFMAVPTLFRIAPDAPPAIIKLVPGGVVRGHLSDDRGLPLENFSVELIPVSLQATGAAVSANSVTLSPGTSVKLNVRALQADATVSGTALKNGHPCAGAMIVLVPEDSTQSAALFHRDQSDSDGTFTMSPVFPGRYTLLAIENGWDLEWSKLSVLFSYLAAGVPLEVKPGANVSINVRVQ